MSTMKKLLSASALALALPVAAAASTSLTTVTFDYGTGPGKDQPFGDDPVNADDVRVFDTSTATGYAQFSEVFDFGDLMGATVDRIDVTLNYSRVSFAQPTGPADQTGEIWWARVLGVDNGTLDDDYFTELAGTGPSVNGYTFSLTAADDLTAISDRPDSVTTLNSAFATSVAENRVRLRFREETAGDDNFVLLSASVEVFGTPAPVPLPASGLLLLGALGGAAAWKRRKSA